MDVSPYRFYSHWFLGAIIYKKINNIGKKDISAEIHMEWVNNEEETIPYQFQYETGTTE